MSKEAIQSLPTRELRAIIRSTNPSGLFWQQVVWAKDELVCRAAR